MKTSIIHVHSGESVSHRVIHTLLHLNCCKIPKYGIEPILKFNISKNIINKFSLKHNLQIPYVTCLHDPDKITYKTNKLTLTRLSGGWGTRELTP